MGAALSQDEIILCSVNDAYTVSLSQNNCVIKAYADGTYKTLSSAYADVVVKKGGEAVSFTISPITTSNSLITYEIVPGHTIFSGEIHRYLPA